MGKETTNRKSVDNTRKFKLKGDIEPDETALVFRAIADKTRRQVLVLLAKENKMSVNDIAGHFAVSRPAISKHLRRLKRAELVQQKKVGREQYYSLNPKPLDDVSEWIENLEKFWTSKLAALGLYLQSDQTE